MSHTRRQQRPHPMESKIARRPTHSAVTKQKNGCFHFLLLAVVAVGVAAAAVAVVDEARGRHVQSAEVIVAGTLAIELAGTEVDVGGAVAVHPGLGNKASGTSIAGVKGNRLEDGEHCDGFVVV
jgi:hypothetical protein